jgi:hypothetical protein
MPLTQAEIIKFRKSTSLLIKGFIKRFDLVMSAPGLVANASGQYTYAWTTEFKDYSNVAIIAIMCQVKFQWQSGPDAVYRYLTYRSGTSIRGNTPVPGTFDGQMAISFLNNTNPESNGYWPVITALSPPQLSVSSDLTLWIPINELIKLPEPMQINQPWNGFAGSIYIQAPDLAQLTDPATIFDFWARVQFWIKVSD